MIDQGAARVSLASITEIIASLTKRTAVMAVLRVGRDHLDCEQMAFGVDDGVALDALGLLARIIADRVDRGPPFSVAFATWVSMMPAVGSGSRPHALRHCSRSA